MFILITPLFLLLLIINTADARKFHHDPKLRVKKNLEEGRGFRLKDQLGKAKRWSF